MDIRYGEMSEINPGGRKFKITDLLSGFHKFSVVQYKSAQSSCTIGSSFLHFETRKTKLEHGCIYVFVSFSMNSLFLAFLNLKFYMF